MPPMKTCLGWRATKQQEAPIVPTLKHKELHVKCISDKLKAVTAQM